MAILATYRTLRVRSARTIHRRTHVRLLTSAQGANLRVAYAQGLQGEGRDMTLSAAVRACRHVHVYVCVYTELGTTYPIDDSIQGGWQMWSSLVHCQSHETRTDLRGVCHLQQGEEVIPVVAVVVAIHKLIADLVCISPNEAQGEKTADQIACNLESRCKVPHAVDGKFDTCWRP